MYYLNNDIKLVGSTYFCYFHTGWILYRLKKKKWEKRVY